MDSLRTDRELALAGEVGGDAQPASYVEGRAGAPAGQIAQHRIKQIGSSLPFGSFMAGLPHPVLGLDHFLAMVSVGIVSE